MKVLKDQVVGVLVLFFIVGCNYTIPRHEGQAGNSKEGAQQDPGGGTTPSFSQVNKAVFQPHCVRCHGFSGGVSLENFAQVRQHLDRIQAAVAGGRMPPSGPLPAQAGDLLFAWIEAGAPEVAEPEPGHPDPPSEGPPPANPQPEPLEPTFLSIQKNVITRKCLNCHSGARPAGSVYLETYEDVIELVDLEEPQESDLIEVLLSEDGRPPAMPPVRSQIPPVSFAQIQIILQWIEKGASR